MLSVLLYYVTKAWDLIRNAVLWACAIALVILSSCAKSSYEPRDGDLLFVVSGYSDFSNAIVSATAVSDSIQFVHVAILELEDDKPFVIEAKDSLGVVRVTLDDFLSNCPTINGEPGVVVKRVDDLSVAKQAVVNAQKYIGRAYDWYYLPDNDKMYCSELVYESYLTSDGNHIFTTAPMSFRDKNGQIPDFWLELFQNIGEDIPEGIPGTNPNDMARDSALVEVARLF